MSFKKISSEEKWRGRIATVEVGRFEHTDGECVDREIIDHPGASVVLALEENTLHLIRQPREVVGEDTLLELPAGKIDLGEDPLGSAKRELAEEIGKGARNWQHIKSVYATPGISNEVFHLYLATDLYDVDAQPDEHERIEIESVKVDQLSDVVEECRDAKTLVGLYWLIEDLRKASK